MDNYWYITYHLDHPSYESYDLENDISLLLTTEQFIWTDAVKPVCLPSSNLRPDDHITRDESPSYNHQQVDDPICAISGFGSTYGGHTSPVSKLYFFDWV